MPHHSDSSIWNTSCALRASLMNAFVLLICLLPLVITCDTRTSSAASAARDGQEQRGGMDPTVREAAEWISRGECNRGEQILKASKARGAWWYEFMSQVHMCRWRKTPTESERSEALAVLEDGLRAFPRNANLVLSKAYRYQEFGDQTRATELFDQAETIAQESAGLDSAAASEIIEASERGKRESNRHANPSPGLAFAHGVRLINEGRCLEAGKVLDSVSAADRLHGWYVARLNAADCCWMMKSAQSADCRQDAERTLAVGLQRYPKSLDLVAAGAFFEERAGKRAEAIQHFTLLLELCKDDASKCQPPFSPGEIRLHLKQLGARQGFR
jgi:tetratricopeptide (TPR) repeat protein